MSRQGPWGRAPRGLEASCPRSRSGRISVELGTPPSDAPTTSCPSSRSKSASSFRRTVSSSATRIFIDVPSGEQDGERGANTRLGGRFDRTAVARDDVLRERQAEAESL